MKINGKEFSFSITDIEDAKKYEAALNTMQKTEDGLKKAYAQKKVSYPDMLRKNIDMLGQFFVDTTGVDVLEGVTDYLVATDLYKEFLYEVGKAKEAILSPFSSDRVR